MTTPCDSLSKNVTLDIRPVQFRDESAIWSILEPIIRAGETYALPRNMTREAAIRYWIGSDRNTFVAEENDKILGSYYLRANQAGGGSHVANCGYVTAPEASGRGVARSMCLHSLGQARERKFRAMQFNLVVSTNGHAVALWQKLGFEIIGTLPKAFAHPEKGDVDALVMYQLL